MFYAVYVCSVYKRNKTIRSNGEGASEEICGKLMHKSWNLLNFFDIFYTSMYVKVKKARKSYAINM